MVKSWARELVEEYKTDFAPKIDWEAAKQQPGQFICNEVKKDGCSYDVQHRYFPPGHDGPTEMFEIQFKKYLTNERTMRMFVNKGDHWYAKYGKHIKKTSILKGDDDSYYTEFVYSYH
jgi:hypothetical protein